MKPVASIHTVELFPPLSRELLALLRTLTPADWARPTVCAPWTVKDVAVHLLGGSLARVCQRGNTPAPAEKSALGFEELLALINRDNQAWVEAARRISPEVLIDFLELTDHRVYEHFKSLPPDEPARITVAWASDSLPPNWFDIAREYTEKWLHQQHIREAVGAPLLTGRELFHPVLDTFMRALPRAYRGLQAADGTSLSVAITGEAGGEWSLVRTGSDWQLFVGRHPQAACQVRIDQDLAWRLFTRGITKEEARQKVQINGDMGLGEQVLEMVSIMA